MEKAVEWLACQWRESGVEAGDMLLLHSSVKRTVRRLLSERYPANVDIILDSFLEALGSEGTLLIPLFNFDFNAGKAFDIRSTPSQMGALTEAARLRSGTVRTGHPVYSFAALGRRRDLFANIDNVSGYGADSPFAILRRDGGKIGVLDLPDVNSMTFYHHVEELEQVDYRYRKRFTGEYTDAVGKATNRTYELVVRDIDRGVETDVDPMGELLWNENLYRGSRANAGSGLRVIDAAVLYSRTARVIAEGLAEGLLFSIGKQ